MQLPRAFPQGPTQRWRNDALRPADSPVPEKHPEAGGSHPSTRPLLTVDDLAALLGLSPRGARLVLERGELPGFRLGRRWYLRSADLDAAIELKVEERRAAPPSSPAPGAPVARHLPGRRATRDPDAAVRILRGLPAVPIPARNP